MHRERCCLCGATYQCMWMQKVKGDASGAEYPCVVCLPCWDKQ